MSAGTLLARARLSFWRIVDTPFETCAAALDGGQRGERWLAFVAQDQGLLAGVAGCRLAW